MTDETHVPTHAPQVTTTVVAEEIKVEPDAKEEAPVIQTPA